jgi:hypothetical protein
VAREPAQSFARLVRRARVAAPRPACAPDQGRADRLRAKHGEAQPRRHTGPAPAPPATFARRRGALWALKRLSPTTPLAREASLGPPTTRRATAPHPAAAAAKVRSPAAATTPTAPPAGPRRRGHARGSPAAAPSSSHDTAAASQLLEAWLSSRGTGEGSSRPQPAPCSRGRHGGVTPAPRPGGRPARRRRLAAQRPAAPRPPAHPLGRDGGRGKEGRGR